ncbi:hypothetical protein S40288_10612 [Stachybotrys chartarum IBT 40288]|nr:hypothetical protein S40288_10612 [Stachybotrys chartarum IBT 40288]
MIPDPPLHSCLDPDQATRIPHQERTHGQQHQRPVKHIHRPLIRQQVPIVAHPVLDRPEHIPRHDKQRRAVQHVQDPAPPNVRRQLRVLPPRKPPVEDARHREVRREDADLENQPAQDDVLPRLRGTAVAVAVRALHEQARAAGLEEEAEAVAHDEDPRQPAGSHGPKSPRRAVGKRSPDVSHCFNYRAGQVYHVLAVGQQGTYTNHRRRKAGKTTFCA